MHRPTAVLAAALLCAAALPGTARAQTGSGVPYGARDARRCAAAAPRRAPTAAQATQAVVCGYEGVRGSSNGSRLYLVEQVRVEVGRGKRYDPGQYTVGTDLDPSAPVYPIRGSQVTYACSTRQSVQEAGNDPARNCTLVEEPAASGICYTTSFGHLACSMTNQPPVAIQQWHYDVAPPRP